MVTFVTCVPTSRFNELKSRNDSITAERDRLLAENEQIHVDKTELDARIEQMETGMTAMNTEKNSLQEDYDELKNEYDLLSRKYDDLVQSQETLLSGHTRETRRLLTELQKTQEDLQLKEDRLKEIEENAARKMQDLEQLKVELDQRNRRMIELESVLHSKDSIMNALKNTISKALYGFQQDGLSVSIRNGEVYVSMEEKLLFQTGSIEVDPKGISALKQLAVILEQNPDIFITIEGHTDDVPVIRNASFQDNWDLSVKRATSIVRILLDNSKINPQRLIASGRGEFLPVDPRKDPVARRKNRRTEIILTPRLDELYKLLETK